MKKIKFVLPKNGSDMIAPSPVKNHIPQWYKDGEMYDENGSAALKTCVPFLDIMLTGYVLTTIDDIRISKTDSGILIEDGKIDKDGNFSPYQEQKKHNHPVEEAIQVKSKFINERKSNTGSTIPRPPGHLNNHFVWQGKWGWKVPRGYSVIVSHPFNRLDLPFTTLNGIIDSDGWVPSGNIPFFLREDFEGIILKGTPVAQLFPYKRESWTMSISKILQSRLKIDANVKHDIVGYYKKKHWNRKNYN